MTHSVCLVSILRAVFIHELEDSKDVTWDYVSVNNWNAVEINTAIVVPCLIVLKPLLVKLFPGLSTPHHSNNPRDAPPTIGSAEANTGRDRPDIYEAVGPSVGSSIWHADEEKNNEAKHVASIV